MSEIDDAFAEHAAVVEASSALRPVIEQAAHAIEAVLSVGGKVLAFGNGGSAADAQHFTSELVGRFVGHRSAWPAVCLNVDASSLTAISNDYGFEHVFSRQLEAHAVPGDIVVVISVSGTSPNIVAGARTARDRGCSVVALTGRGGGDVGGLADIVVAVPSDAVPRVQEVHGLVLHAVAARLDRRLPARPDPTP